MLNVLYSGRSFDIQGSMVFSNKNYPHAFLEFLKTKCLLFIKAFDLLSLAGLCAKLMAEQAFYAMAGS